MNILKEATEVAQKATEATQKENQRQAEIRRVEKQKEEEIENERLEKAWVVLNLDDSKRKRLSLLIESEDPTQIRTLTLKGKNFLTDSDLELLKSLPQLRELILVENEKITDSSLAYLKDLKDLQQLYVLDCPISDSGLEHLKGLKKLIILELTRTKTTRKGLQDLKTTIPNCRIIWGSGGINNGSSGTCVPCVVVIVKSGQVAFIEGVVTFLFMESRSCPQDYYITFWVFVGTGW